MTEWVHTHLYDCVAYSVVILGRDEWAMRRAWQEARRLHAAFSNDELASEGLVVALRDSWMI